MRVAVVGGGPGGLFFAVLLRHADLAHEVTVFERNTADDTFGFGVVFSDRTLAGIEAADPVLIDAVEQHGQHWDEIWIRLKGERLLCRGNGMAAISRRLLLQLLQGRAIEAGATLMFERRVELADLHGYDLVVVAEGTNSAIRDALDTKFNGVFGSTVETAAAKFIWFGTDYRFDGLTFVHELGPHGVFSVHGYPISEDVSTFIAETDAQSWRASGLDSFDTDPRSGASDLKSKEYLERLFAEQIDGRQLLVNNSRWASFRTRRTARWHTLHPQPVVLIGDAAHTAHFSVGSGTKMAMEDAMTLAHSLVEHSTDLATALDRYESVARPPVDAVQESARPSLSWWEHVGRYHAAFEPWQFAYHFLSRSISDSRLARRDRGFVGATHAAWAERHGAEPLASTCTIGGLNVASRVVVVDEVDGVPVPDWQSCSLRAAGVSPVISVVEAPSSDGSMVPSFGALAAATARGVAAVVIYGGTAHTRRLLCEQARLHHRVPAILVDPGMTHDAAVTAVLSGRADLVGVTRHAAPMWLGEVRAR